MYGASSDAVPQPVPIPTRTFLLMFAAPIENAVSNAPNQRLAQPPPPTAPAITNLPPVARHEWNSGYRNLLLKSANRVRFTKSSGVLIRAFIKDTEKFCEMCWHTATVRLALSSRGSTGTKRRKYAFLIWFQTKLITPHSEIVSSHILNDLNLKISTANSCTSSLKPELVALYAARTTDF